MTSNYDQFLISACSSLKIEEVQKAIQKGANVNAVGKYSEFPLLTCVDFQEAKDSKLIIEILDLLLNNGADIDFQVDDDETALIHSAWLLHSYDVVEFLLNKGANPNLIFDGETALDLTGGEISFTATCLDEPDVLDELERIYELLERSGGKHREDL